MSDAQPPRKIGRGIWRGVYSSIVDHPDFQILSPNARLTLFVCRCGSLNTPASIFRYYRGVLEAQTGLDATDLEAALVELEKKPSTSAPWIVRDESILWVRNGLKHDPNLTLEHDGHREAILRALAALPTTPTVQKFKRYYKLVRGRGQAPPKGPPPQPKREGGSAVGKESSRTPKEERKDEKTSAPPDFSSLSRIGGGSNDEHPDPADPDIMPRACSMCNGAHKQAPEQCPEFLAWRKTIHHGVDDLAAFAMFTTRPLNAAGQRHRPLCLCSDCPGPAAMMRRP